MQHEPLKEAEVDALIEQLFRPLPLPAKTHFVYAVLDGARDGRIYSAVRYSAMPWACLFAGKLHPALEMAAPYLVQLRRSSLFTRFILQNGWGNAWGIFASSTADLEDLRRHFRRFLRVVDERGKRLFFRYYDPRVLRVYLPTCTEAELKTVFGPVQRFSVEASERGRVIEHVVRERALVTEAAEVGGAAA